MGLRCGSFLQHWNSEAPLRKRAWTCEFPRQVLVFSFWPLGQLSLLFYASLLPFDCSCCVLYNNLVNVSNVFSWVLGSIKSEVGVRGTLSLQPGRSEVQVWGQSCATESLPSGIHTHSGVRIELKPEEKIAGWEKLPHIWCQSGGSEASCQAPVTCWNHSPSTSLGAGPALSISPPYLMSKDWGQLQVCFVFYSKQLACLCKGPFPWTKRISFYFLFWN